MDSGAINLAKLKLEYVKEEIQNIIYLLDQIDYETPENGEVSDDNTNLFSYRLEKLKRLFDKVFDDINLEQIEAIEAKRISAQILSNVRKYLAERTDEENTVG